MVLVTVVTQAIWVLFFFIFIFLFELIRTANNSLLCFHLSNKPPEAVAVAGGELE